MLDLQDFVAPDQSGLDLGPPIEVQSQPPITGLNLDTQPSSTSGFALDPDEVARIHSQATVAGGPSNPVMNQPSTPQAGNPMMDRYANIQNFLKDRSMGERAAYALEALGAGIQGRSPLVDQHMKLGQENEKIAMARKEQEVQAFKATYGMFDESFKILKRVPPEKRTDAIQQLGARMDSVSPGAGKAFTAYANYNDTDLEGAAMGIFGDPDVSKALMKLSGGDEANFYKLITNKDTMDMLKGQVDQKRLPSVVKKMSALRAIPEDQYPEGIKVQKDGEGNILLDSALLRNVNDKLPAGLKFSEGEFQTIDRNPDQFISAGFVPPKTQADMQKKAMEKDQWGDAYQVDGAWVQRNKSTGEIRQAVTRPPVGPIVNVDTQGNQVFSQEHQLRQDYDKASTKFQDMKAYFLPVARKVESGKPLGPAESLQLAYAYAHSLDPGQDRITEGDFKRLNELGSIPQRIYTAINGVLNGYNLPSDTAKEMYSVAARQFKELNNRQRINEDRYTRMSTEYPGLSPERVVRKYSVDDKSSPKPPPEKQGVRSVEQIVADGKENGWSDLTVENTIREMHNEDAVRKWRTEASAERMKRRERRGKP